jgi:hypothetical protein
MKIEVNLSPAERIARMIIALPLSIPVVYLEWTPLFFLPMYIAVTGICGIALEYTLFKRSDDAAPQEKMQRVDTVNDRKERIDVAEEEEALV